jgi:hypothetical protein
MSALMRDIATAALPVAIVLVVLAGAAAAVARGAIDDARAQRIAREHLGALATWGLGAVAVYTVALGAAGEAGAGAFVLPLLLGIAAVLLRPAAGPARRRDARPPKPAPARRAAPAAASARSSAAPAAPVPPAPVPAAPHPSLWAEAAEDESRRTGLWSRG